MPDTAWLERVENELIRRRLPRLEVARLVAELGDHLDDRAESRRATRELSDQRQFPDSPFFLTEKNMSMDASVIESVGAPEQIAEAAAREYRRRRNLLSRSRLAQALTFVVLPLPALCLLWALIILALWLAVDYVDIDPNIGNDVATPGVVLAMHAFSLGLLLVPPVALAAFYGRIARHAGRSWLWGLSACLLVGLGAGLVQYTVTLSDGSGRDTTMFGIGWPIPRLQIAQSLLPLSIGSLVLLRSARKTKEAAA